MERRDASEDGRRGRDYWRSLDELAHGEELRRWMQQEFPAGVEAALSEPSRRDVLRVLAASLALGGAAACRERPTAEIVPYSHAPDHALRAGRSLFFATAILHEGFAGPALVESVMGRPIKVEGNPEHPESQGATDVFSQAAVLRLYDPDRSRTVRFHDRIATWGDFGRAWSAERARLLERGGEGLRVLTGRCCSPSVDAALARMLEGLPGARWHRHEPIDDAAAREATRRALGRELALFPRFERARRVLTLASDFLFESPSRVRHALDFAEARRVWRRPDGDMLRLYAVEPTPTLTGANADHRLPRRAAELPAIARRAAALLGVAVPGGDVRLDEHAEHWLAACAEALRSEGPRSIVLAGHGAPAEVHALALAMNAALGSLGETLVAHPRADRSELGPPGTLEELIEDARAGAVDSVVVLGSNPAYTAPAELEVGRALAELPGTTVHAGEFHDETARACAWHLPLAHELECWQDARSPQGRVTIVQPLIEPLYRGRAPQVVLRLLAAEEEADDRETIRASWRERLGAEFDDVWPEALRRGWIEGTESEPVDVEVDGEAVREMVEATESAKDGALEIVFRPDDTVWDGRHANNPWLQELPKPLNQLTWDNAALVSPALAERMGLRAGDVVRLELGGRSVEAPVQPMPGQPDGSVCAPLGYGRRAAGRVGDGAGFDAYRLRPAGRPWSANGLSLAPLGRRRELAHTQHHHLMEGRHHLRAGTLEEYRAGPAAIAGPRHMEHLRPEEPGAGLRSSEPSLLPEWRYEGQQWGMAIDLTACIGCGACTIACQAENNIPVVGKREVLRGREMHWIRVDCYHDGPRHDPGFWFQPVPCMHCEKAPCELVCPVGATQHSHDGMNDMVYNRCVGTRYCSNNCPYKVRRFNFLSYAPDEPAPRDLQRNPEVTVRSRGVMEKCTYCVQRVRKAEVRAREEGRPIRDGEVRTACQAVCPARAITFGDIADPDTEVSRWKREEHGYGMLADLNTQPRTTYLACITHPDPALEGRQDAKAR